MLHLCQKICPCLSSKPEPQDNALPIRNKRVEKGRLHRDTYYISAATQGWRPSMEDRYCNFLHFQSGMQFYGVFDGHAGSHTAQMLTEHLFNIICAQETFRSATKNMEDYLSKNDPNYNNNSNNQEMTDQENKNTIAKKLSTSLEVQKSISPQLNNQITNRYIQGISSGFIQMDNQLSQDNQIQIDISGSTGVVVMIDQIGNFYCSWLGDSRAIISHGGRAQELTYDHLPTNPEEYLRIKKAQMFVSNDRVNGSLAMSRAFGDFIFKQHDTLSAENQAVSCQPDIHHRKLDYNKDEFIILGSDGLWEMIDAQKCVDFVRKKLAANFKKVKNYDNLLQRANNSSNNNNSNNNQTESQKSPEDKAAADLAKNKNNDNGKHNSFTEQKILQDVNIIPNQIETIVQELIDMAVTDDIMNEEGIGCDNITATIILIPGNEHEKYDLLNKNNNESTTNNNNNNSNISNNNFTVEATNLTSSLKISSEPNFYQSFQHMLEPLAAKSKMMRPASREISEIAGNMDSMTAIDHITGRSEIMRCDPDFSFPSWLWFGWNLCFFCIFQNRKFV